MADSRWLWVIRHAKTANPRFTRDYDRPLAERGEREADVIGAQLAAHVGRPTFIISSAALRARTTAEALNTHLNADLITSADLYGAGPETLLDAVCSLPADVRSAALVGHNPGVSQFASLLDSTVSSEGLPTLGTVGFNFDREWVEVAFGNLSRQVLWRPKDFR